MVAFVWRTVPGCTLRVLHGVAVQTTADGTITTRDGQAVARRAIVALVDEDGHLLDDTVAV